MKVILTQEVKGRGGEGDVVDVARGFAVNYLFPRSMAIEATPGNLKQLELRLHKIRTREDARNSDAQAIADLLNGKSVSIEAKVGEEGRLFGSVTHQMIEDAIAEQLEADIDRRKIEAHGNIKEVGDHTVTVQIYREIKADVTVSVVPEGGKIVHEPVTAEDIVAEADALEAEQAAEETAETVEVAEVADEVLVVESAEEVAEDDAEADAAE